MEEMTEENTTQNTSLNDANTVLAGSTKPEQSKVSDSKMNSKADSENTLQEMQKHSADKSLIEMMRLRIAAIQNGCNTIDAQPSTSKISIELLYDRNTKLIRTYSGINRKQMKNQSTDDKMLDKKDFTSDLPVTKGEVESSSNKIVELSKIDNKTIADQKTCTSVPTTENQDNTKCNNLDKTCVNSPYMKHCTIIKLRRRTRSSYKDDFHQELLTVENNMQRKLHITETDEVSTDNVCKLDASLSKETNENSLDNSLSNHQKNIEVCEVAELKTIEDQKSKQLTDIEAPQNESNIIHNIQNTSFPMTENEDNVEPNLTKSCAKSSFSRSPRWVPTKSIRGRKRTRSFYNDSHQNMLTVDNIAEEDSGNSLNKAEITDPKTIEEQENKQSADTKALQNKSNIACDIQSTSFSVSENQDNDKHKLDKTCVKSHQSRLTVKDNIADKTLTNNQYQLEELLLKTANNADVDNSISKGQKNIKSAEMTDSKIIDEQNSKQSADTESLQNVSNDIQSTSLLITENQNRGTSAKRIRGQKRTRSFDDDSHQKMPTLEAIANEPSLPSKETNEKCLATSAKRIRGQKRTRAFDDDSHQKMPTLEAIANEPSLPSKETNEKCLATSAKRIRVQKRTRSFDEDSHQKMPTLEAIANEPSLPSKEINEKCLDNSLNNNKMNNDDLHKTNNAHTTISSENNMESTNNNLSDSIIIKKRRRRKRYQEGSLDFQKCQRRQSPRLKPQSDNQLLQTPSTNGICTDPSDSQNTNLITVPLNIKKRGRKRLQEHSNVLLFDTNIIEATSTPVEKKKRGRSSKAKIQNNEFPTTSNYDSPLTNISVVKSPEKPTQSTLSSDEGHKSPPFHGFPNTSNYIEDNNLLTANFDNKHIKSPLGRKKKLTHEYPLINTDLNKADKEDTNDKTSTNDEVKRVKQRKRKQSIQLRKCDNFSECILTTKVLTCNNFKLNQKTLKIKKGNEKQALETNIENINVNKNKPDGKPMETQPIKLKIKKAKKQPLTAKPVHTNQLSNIQNELLNNNFKKFKEKKSSKNKVANTKQHSYCVSDDLNNNLNETIEKQTVYIKRPLYTSKTLGYIKYNDKKLIINTRTKKKSQIKLQHNDSLVNLSRGASLKVPNWAWETFFMQYTLTRKQQDFSSAIEGIASAQNNQIQKTRKGHLKNVGKSIIKKLLEYRKGIGEFHKFGYLCESDGLLSYSCNLFKCLKESACSCEKIPINEAKKEELAALEESLTLYTDRYYKEKYYNNESRPVTCDEGVSTKDLEDIGVIKMCHVSLTKYDLSNMVPLCLEHSVYDCFCHKPSFDPVRLLEYLRCDLESTADNENCIKINRTNIQLRCLRWDAFVNLCISNEGFNVWYTDTSEISSLTITLDDIAPAPSYNKITKHFTSHEFKSFKYLYWSLNKIYPQHKSLDNMWLVLRKKERYWKIFNCTDDIKVKSRDNPYFILAGECHDNIDNIDFLEENVDVDVEDKEVHDHEVTFDFNSNSNSPPVADLSNNNIEIKEDIPWDTVNEDHADDIIDVECNSDKSYLYQQNIGCSMEDDSEKNNITNSQTKSHIINYDNVKSTTTEHSSCQNTLTCDTSIVNTQNKDESNSISFQDNRCNSNKDNNNHKCNNVEDTANQDRNDVPGDQNVVVSIANQDRNGVPGDQNVVVSVVDGENNADSNTSRDRIDFANYKDVIVSVLDEHDNADGNKSNSTDGNDKITCSTVNFHDYLGVNFASNKNVIACEETVVKEKEIKDEEVELLTEDIEKHFDQKKLISNEINTKGKIARIVLKVKVPTITIAGKWRMLRMRPDLAYIKFSRCNAIVNSKCILDAICKAFDNKTTVLIKSTLLENRYHHSNFGIYCVQNYLNKIFIGPYLLNSNDDLEVFVNNDGKCMKANENSEQNDQVYNDHWFFQEKHTNSPYLCNSGNNVQIVSVIDLTYDDDEEDKKRKNSIPRQK